MMLLSPFQAFADWRQSRRTIRELSRLSDRELGDLGIGRADIGAVAHRQPLMSRDEVEAVVTGRLSLARLADGEMIGADRAAHRPTSLAA